LQEFETLAERGRYVVYQSRAETGGEEKKALRYPSIMLGRI
jgi:hypothetical protein